jgi:four helix bundle protein
MGEFVKKDITERTFKFGVKIINIARLLPRDSVGIVISKQIIRSGTSVGANVEEAQDAISRKEFIRCMNIGLKEARETFYWLRIILKSNLLLKIKLDVIMVENIEIIKILTAIIKKSKLNLK